MITCGTDIIEIKRIQKSIENLGEKFLNKVYTKAEIEYCESKNIQKYQHYAARFAAKEAVFKALTGRKNIKTIDWQNIETLNDENGRPYLNINGKTCENMDISISHCKEYAIATVIVSD